MRVLLRMALLTAMVVALALPASAQEGFDGNITIDGDGYSPRDMTIAAGSTIRWTNVGTEPASVTGAGMTSFDSSPACTMERTDVCLQQGASYTQTFFTPRTIVYRSRISNATGVLRVVAADAEGAPAPVDAAATGAVTAQTDQPAGDDSAPAADTTDATPGTGLPRTGGGAAGLAGLGLLAGAAALRGRRG